MSATGAGGDGGDGGAAAAGPAAVEVRLFPGAGHGLPYQESAGVVAALHEWWATLPSASPPGDGAEDPDSPSAPTPTPTLLPGLFWL